MKIHKRFALALGILAALLLPVSVTAAPSALTGPKAKTTTAVLVQMLEMKFVLSKKVAPRGKVLFKGVNKGQLPHDLKIAGKKTAVLKPGGRQTIAVVFRKKGRYPFICTVPGHAAAGMKGVFTVR